MKRKLRAIPILTVILLLLTQTAAPALAAEGTKDETVYVNLGYGGSVETTYVVNAFTVPESGTVYDYGNYISIKNLSGTGEPTVENGLITWHSEPGTTFYYQGELADASLPWNFEIDYSLDGKNVPAPSLIGAGGHLEITVGAELNADADPYFGDNYAAQITISLDEKLCRNVQTDGETVTAGGLKTVAFTVLPGASGSYKVSADVTDFEMDGITINMVRMAGGVLSSVDDLKGAMSQITDGISALSDGTGQLKDGASDLVGGLGLVSDGADTLARAGESVFSGFGDLQSGAAGLYDGLSQLADSSGQIRDGLRDLGDGSYDLEKGYDSVGAGLAAMTEKRGEVADGVAELEDSGEDMMSGMRDLSTGAGQLADGIGTLHGTYAAQTALVDGLISYIQQQYAANPEAMPAELQQLIGGIGQYEAGIDAGFTNLETGAHGVDTGVSQAYGGMSSLYKAALSFGDGSLELMDGAQELGSGMTALNAGFEKYAKGVGDLAENYIAFDSGLSDALAGAQSLSDGAGEMGTGLGTYFSSVDELAGSLDSLDNGAQALPEGIGELGEGADRMLAGLGGGLTGGILDVDSGAETVSFAAPGQVTPESVQFIVKTPDLHADEAETAETPAESRNFWQKVRDLFAKVFS